MKDDEFKRELRRRLQGTTPGRRLAAGVILTLASLLELKLKSAKPASVKPEAEDPEKKE